MSLPESTPSLTSVPTDPYALSAGGREFGLTVDTDISLNGETARHWLLSGEKNLEVRDNEKALIASYSWDEITSVRTVTCVGCGLLQVKVNEEWRDALRFSNALSDRFHKVSRRLDQSCEKESDEDSATEEEATLPLWTDADPLDPPRCADCNMRLPARLNSCPRCLQKGQIFTRVWELLRPHWKGGVMVILLTIVGICAELVPPKLQQYMVDSLLTGKVATDVDVNQALLLVVLALAFSRVLLSVVGVIKGRLSSLIGSGITCNLRKQMVEKLQSMAVSYYDKHQVGALISRVAHDSESLNGLMNQLTGGFLLQIFQLLGVGVMLFSINAKLAFYTLIPVPFVLLGSWFFWKKVYPRFYRLWDAASKQMTTLNGMLNGIRVVKAFAREDSENQRFVAAADRLREWRVWVAYANARYSAMMQIVFSLGGLIVWYVGGKDVIENDDMTLGQLIAFLAYLAMFYAPLSQLSNFTTWLTSFLSGSKRVLELMDTPVSIMDPDEPAAWSDPRGELEFDGVTFGYDEDQPVLNDINFTVAPGEMVGIVGRSGSGKTTMVNLLGRFYDPQEGSVKIDGQDIRNYPIKELRQNLGVVFQDSFLFRGTIWKNLAYGCDDLAVEEGLAKTKAAGAHDFICNKALAYETQLGEQGAGLSGGERQRLSIARTLLYDPKILILDEATSSIDAEAEKTIQDALQVLVKGRTTIAIAHRLSTLRNADRILVFDRGRLIEEGSHAELLDADGTYARLVRIQTQVSKTPNVDRLLVEAEGELEDEKKDAAPSASEINWLTPDNASLTSRDGQPTLTHDGETHGIFLIRTFPASRPESYLSVRTWDEDGDDYELGIIRHLEDWTIETRGLLRDALERRYLLREITAIHGMRLDLGFLECDVETPKGRMQFAMRWTSGRGPEFGENGKLLIDMDGNRWVVPDVETLPPGDREKFLQHIYW